jgi:threonine/homoserine/homoserine lactone efflux protein
MTTILLSGLLLGLYAGLSPGPLMALLLTQTLRHGPREGCKVALVPLLTDLPIILVAVALASKLSELQPLLGMLSIAGGAFVMYLAYDAWRPARLDTDVAPTQPRSWFKGILTNVLSPHPWLFWMTVGAASLAKALAVGRHAAVAFLALFYGLLVGSKLVMALLAGRSRRFLAGRPYRIINRALGVLLAAFAALLIREGIRLVTGASAL